MNRRTFMQASAVALIWVSCVWVSCCAAPSTNAPTAFPSLKVGVASVDITPNGPVWVDGHHMTRQSPSTGVFKNVTASCLVFDNGRTRVGVMAVDVLMIDSAEFSAIRAAAEKVGIPASQMIINVSHTHCGPALDSKKNPAYVKQFLEKTTGLWQAAVNDLKEAKLDFALGNCTMGVNRRQIGPDGKPTGMRPEPRKPIDPDVPVLRILTPSNQVRAIVFSYACHPTSMYGLEISSDYVGFARDWIAAAYPNCTPLFLQGCGGDVKPRCVTPDGKFGYVLLDMKQTCAELGHELGRAVIAAVSVPPQPVSGLPNQPLPLAVLSETVSAPDKKTPTTSRGIALAALRIGNVYILFSQREVCVEIGLRIKRELAEWSRQNQSSVWICAYSHARSGGYVPAASSYAEGGYEVDVSMFGAGTEDIMVRKAVELIKSSSLSSAAVQDTRQRQAARAPDAARLSSTAPRDIAQPEWGPLWQPRLPARERHPSLFFDDTDRTRMQERLKQPPIERWWKTFSASKNRCAPAMQWWLLGDEAAARRAREDLVGKPIGRDPRGLRVYASADMFADYVLAYDVLAAWPGLTSQDQTVIRGKIAAEAEFYFEAIKDGQGGQYGNQVQRGASALGLAALALCEHRQSATGPAKWMARVLYEIRREEDWWYFRQDGLYANGLGYHEYGGILLVPFAIAYERATGQYLLQDERLWQWLIFGAYQLTAQRDHIMLGTSEGYWGLRQYVLLSNRRYGRDLAPLFNWVYDWQIKGPHPQTLWKTPQLSPIVPYNILFPAALALWEKEVPGAMPPASRAFPRSQVAVLRKDWGHDTVSVWFMGKDKTWPKRLIDSKSHADSGHFVIAAWDEVLANDSGYDHWVSRDYYGAEFHNVLLIDGKGPAQDTAGEMSDIVTEGPVRRATVTTSYQGCAVRRTLALVRDRYVVVADRVAAAGEHDYAWRVRSTCPPDSPGSTVGERAVTWPGMDALQWRYLKPGRTQLTTVVPAFTRLSVEPGRWRPNSLIPEFRNQVAVAHWRAASTTALFVLIPNLKEQPDTKWQTQSNGAVWVEGPGWRDQISITAGELVIRSEDGKLQQRISL